MFRPILFFVFLCSTSLWSQQLVINELDPDTPSIDDKEFIELKSTVPNFSTDGYILVFFNGNNTTLGDNLSYYSIDLNGLTTDINGLLVLGNKLVTPFPQVILSDNLIQNGADAVAIYQSSALNFPEGTPATQTDLVDALVYDTNDTDDTGLLAALGETVQYNDNGTNTNFKSLQRIADGTYVADTPTPRRFNEGGDIPLNTISISTTQTEYIEGVDFTITFTADVNVAADVNFNISLNNVGFTIGDYSGSTDLTIPNGQKTVSTIITLLDDTNNEGDEEMEITFLDLVEPIVPFNNRVIVRVVDNDFTSDVWGTPLNPTYDKVTSTQPVGYYNSLDNLSDNDLRDAIQAIIADPTTVRAQTYADVNDILKTADQNPSNSSQVWLLYKEEGRSKLDLQVTGSGTGKWNREHTFPRSRADYGSIKDDEIADGIDVFWTTNADSLRHGNSDAHALRAADALENSRRSNRNYSNNFVSNEYNGAVNPDNSITKSFRGDVARSVLFIELRYNGLSVINGTPPLPFPRLGEVGDLATLLQWHRDDPVDDFEMNRNNIIYQWQKNRNPLIDQPLLVEYLWGNQIGNLWQQTLSVEAQNELENFSFYPNPTNNKIYFKNLNNTAEFEVFTIDGKKIKTLIIEGNNSVSFDLSSGLYLLKVTENEKSTTHKIIIK